MFKEIDFIVREGGGGYSFWDVYEMPVWLRRLTKNMISDDNREKNAKMAEAQGKPKEMTSSDFKTLKDRLKKDNAPSKPFVTRKK